MKGRIGSWIFILAINLANSQSLSSTLKLAYANLEAEELSEAEMLFRRVAFFDSTAIYEIETIEGLAFISYANARYYEASNYFLNLHRLSGKKEHNHYYILSLLKSKQWLFAKAALLNMSVPDQETQISKDIFLGLVEFNLQNFEVAKEHFTDAENNLGTVINDESVFTALEKVNRKNRTKAIILSGLMPGMGQFYSKHFKEGLNSFLLLTVVGIVYYYTLTNIGFLDAIISVFPWLNRYYVGGMNAAADLVDEYKQEQLILGHNELVKLYAGHIK